MECNSFVPVVKAQAGVVSRDVHRGLVRRILQENRPGRSSYWSSWSERDLSKKN